MHSYRNKKGEVVNVSKEHLDTAVELKQKLQKDSSSNRCSWAKHRTLMKKEGFENSENSENYRQMVKRYQYSLDKLPSPVEITEDVSTSKLQSYKELVGEVTWQTHENREYLKQIRKGKKEIINGSLLIEEMTDTLDRVFGNIDWAKIASHNFSPIKDHEGTRIVALITDWHIGADVDVEGNRYNFEIAQNRINEFTEKLLQIATDKKVYRIDVVYMGDIVEGSFMREGQAYGIEFPVSEQMARGGQLIIELLTKLSTKHFVTYRGFSGNHDRMNQKDKNGNIYGDSAMVVVNKIVKVFIDASKIQNLMYADTHPYQARLIDVNGRNLKLVHGDKVKKADSGKIADHSFYDKVHYDVIAYGHFHHFLCHEVGVDTLEVRVGSTKGSDDYSETLMVGSAPSQVVIVIDSDGEIDVKRIRLH